MCASVDHLSEANDSKAHVNVQPGWQYERFVRGGADSRPRADKTTKRLQGINVNFFGAMKTAFELIEKEQGPYCNEGLSMLQELSKC